MTYPSSTFWEALHRDYRPLEKDVLESLLRSFNQSAYPKEDIETDAIAWVEALRSKKSKRLSIQELLSAYSLDKDEGRALMILAEALLRIPDKATRDALIKEKVISHHWYDGVKTSSSLLAKFAGAGLDLSKHALSLGEGTFFEHFVKFSASITKPFVRQGIIQAIHQMGDLFIVGETIDEAIKKASANPRYGYSFDMLGEAAVSFEDAELYFQHYISMIKAAGEGGHKGVSIKLSALHPRFEALKRNTVFGELSQKVVDLARIAMDMNMRITVDAEESERLNLSLEIFEKAYLDVSLKGYDKLGIAVQAYQKRASCVVDFIADLADRGGKPIPVRLVKGAYWDREIKAAQELGLSDFPVFTRKSHTDISYLACAQKLFSSKGIECQFASHNAHTLAAVIHMGKAYGRAFSLQRLQGMGEQLFDLVMHDNPEIPCEIYAPVGEYKDLLAYLVRRLLENGANTSFIHQINDTRKTPQDLVEDPFDHAQGTEFSSHPKIKLPTAMFEDRSNSKGIDTSDYPTQKVLEEILSKRPTLIQGYMSLESDQVIQRAQKAQLPWGDLPAGTRASIIGTLADKMEGNQELLNLIVHEGRRTVADAISELREAVDFCRYYALHAERLMAIPEILPGPVGERNELSYAPRGVFVCISPWNFPLAIFTGQVVAALVTGNSVIAKPASSTPTIAAALVKLAQSVGVPKDVLQLCHVPSKDMQAILNDPGIAGVVFTGSTQTAWHINRTLAAKDGPIVPLVAETGGLNAMVVDSSALFEQVVQDVITSAFRSAGQRCSALRILCVQEDIGEGFIALLINAMKTLKLGEASDFETDVGPVIDSKAHGGLLADIESLKERAELIYACNAPNEGDFISPQLWKINHIEDVDREIFGPVLQVFVYKQHELEDLIQRINALGFGLTFGLHTRLESTIARVRSALHAGNFYVNRSMIGAVVGVQPFGGEGLSGTGFKAGGPNYLLRFVHERTFTYNTTAAGGNASLVMLTE